MAYHLKPSPAPGQEWRFGSIDYLILYRALSGKLAMGKERWDRTSETYVIELDHFLYPNDPSFSWATCIRGNKPVNLKPRIKA